jgi:hypothetical protein
MTTTSSRPHHRAPELLIPLGVPAEHLAVYTDEQQREIALAQTCYQLRQQRMDPHIPAANNYETVAWQQIEEAIAVLRSLFDARAMPDVTLFGALGWASLFSVVAQEAEQRRQRPPLAMPYRYYTQRELDTLDALNGASDEDDERLLAPRKPRRRARTPQKRSSAARAGY